MRKKAREPEGHHRCGTSLGGGKDGNPPPVDINLEVWKKKHKAVNRTSQITLESDNDIAIIKDIRKGSWVIVLEKV